MLIQGHNLPQCGCPNNFTTRSDSSATFQTLQASVSILDVKVCDSKVETSVASLEGSPRENLFSLKRTWLHGLGL